MTTSTKGTAFVTGASSGIGAIYADRLARRGYDLILVARNRERVDGLAKRVADETGRKIDVVTADLNNKADLGRIEQLLRTESNITLPVNNAGVGSAAPDDMITLNVRALTRLTYAVVPRFVARGGGGIITIPSLREAADWQAYEGARQKLMPNLSRRAPAERYRARATA